MGAVMGTLSSLQTKQRRPSKGQLYVMDYITHQNKSDKIEDELEMATVCYRPEGLEQLESQTNFNKSELQVLYRGFKNECPSGVVNEDTFKQIYSQFFPHGDASMYAHYLFNAFDAAQSGSVKFEDFVAALSVLLRGTIHEKLRWAFNLYDINKDGNINKEEMMNIVKAIYDMMGKYTYPVVKEDAPKQHVEVFFQKMDKNKDGVVTLDEFIESCQEAIKKSAEFCTKPKATTSKEIFSPKSRSRQNRQASTLFGCPLTLTPASKLLQVSFQTSVQD
ncbi:hypothetical protein XELAEV_18021518mg [Xenopus laevis]|uniref:EF-hand domain-containing protein n=2 Tax=Xenopus TaxID=262014 RepID=A0A974D954_XENLA|nr:hypothetical protein XELAEV_18021518mg [Xenopus laevis]